MIQIRTILCPVDMSECSQHAVEHAVALARWYGSTITALHVFDPAPVAAYAPGVPGFAAVDLYQPDRQALTADIRRFLLSTATGVTIDVLSRDGHPAREILAHCDEHQPDLLVIGTHGRSGFERLIFGSVAERVLRRARCPVLSVPPRALGAAAAPVAYRRILCPVDFSESSMEALQYATSLAQEADAWLTVLHVMDYGVQEWADVYEEFMSNQQVTVADLRKRYRELAEERLELAVTADARNSCTVETMLIDGRPYQTILRVAAEQKSDVIVMGVRGRNAIDLAIFGSTTQHVVRLATCPVLTLRDKWGDLRRGALTP